jgi:hypothetical protein
MYEVVKQTLHHLGRLRRVVASQEVRREQDLKGSDLLAKDQILKRVSDLIVR